MKKLFTMLVASLCGTMVYAQTGAVSVNDVTLTKGGTTEMEVTVNNAASNTAFQFDLTLPAGVSVQSVKMGNIVGKKPTETDDTNTRKLKYDVYDANANKYRFLSYDNGNAALTDGKVIVTLAATEEAETGTIAGSEILVVNDEGGKTEQGNGDVASITVADGVKATITSAGQAIFCSNKDLDFTNCGAKAYIVTGYDKESGTIWLTRVNDVPANTAVLLMGAKGDYYPVVAESKTIYENMLVGSVEGTTVNKDAGNGMTNYILSKVNDEVGFYYAKESGSTVKAGGGYLPLPTTIDAVGTAGSNVEISMNKYGMKSYYSDQSLDFSGEADLKAYVATGYDKTGTVLLSRLKEVPAQTGIVLLAPKEAKNYTIPTKSMQQCYANMLNGTLTETTINKLEGDIVNYYVSVKNNEPGFYWASESGTKMNPNTSWLPVPKSMTSLAATARNMGVSESLAVTLNEDIISMKVFSRGIDGETTGISRVAAEAIGNDAWYNLSGQRISAPTKKGLYIKNGKKIVVK